MMMLYIKLHVGERVDKVSKTDIVTRFQALQAEEIQVYGWAVDRGVLRIPDAAVGLGLPQERVARAVESLAAVPLVRPLDPLDPAGPLRPPGGPADGPEDGSEDRPDGRPADRPAMERAWKAVDPQQASAEVAAAESRFRRGLSGVLSVWDVVDSVNAMYDAGVDDVDRGAPLQPVEALGEVIAMLDEAGATCESEVMTAQPGGGRPPGELERSIARDLAMIGRGVRMRTLYQHPARHNAPTQAYVERVTAAGAQVRTLPELLGRMIAFDRRVAFISHHRTSGGAVVIRDPSTVGFLCDAFDRNWQMATPYHPAPLDGGLRDDLKGTILGMLSEGLRDETIARRLGVSLRTCRKYIADIFAQLGAESRFQAGYLTGAQRRLGTGPDESPGVF